jgi:hypothetical protein
VRFSGLVQVCVLACCCLLLTGRSVQAQSGTTAISGRVTDPQGSIVPGVTVTATNRATAGSRTVVTNESGLYQVSALSPGVYDLTIELSGFKTAKFEKIELRVDTPARQDVKLEVGQLSEAVTVLAETPILNTVDASLGNAISEQQIRNLPIEALNVVHLLSLQAGAVFVPNALNNDARNGATNGARADQQTVTLDGVDVNDSQTQSAFTSVLRMTADALQEFKLSTSNYGAEMGRSSGPQVSLVTKSGTNRFSGAGYEFARRTATSSNEYFLKLSQLSQGKPSKAPKLDKDIFGGALGGPIKKNRAFFFGNFERLREHSESPVVRSVPSASYRDGVLMYQCAVAAQCPGGSVAGFTGSYNVPSGYRGLTPADIKALDPLGIGPSLAASQYMKQYPLPNDPGTDSVNLMSHRFAAPIENQFKTYVFKFDVKMSETGAQNLFVRGNAQDDTINAVPQFPGAPPSEIRAVKNKGIAVGYDSVVSSRMVNSFRYGLTRLDSARIGQLKANYVRFRFLDTFDAITSTNGRIIPTHNFIDDLSWMKGTHTVKFGTNLRFSTTDRFDNTNSFYSASINPSWTAGIGRRYAPGNPFCRAEICSQLPVVASGFQAGYADTFTGIIGALTQATGVFNYDKNGNVVPVGQPVARRFAYNEYEGYVSDTWHVSPQLTLSGGLRYSYYTPPWEVNGNQVAPSVSLGDLFEKRRQMGLNGIPANTLQPFTFDLAGKANNRKGYYNSDFNNVAPRVSFAWSPHAESGLTGWLAGGDRLTIRGGYAKVFDRIGQGIATRFDEVGSFGMSTQLSSPFGLAYETNPASRWRDASSLPPTLPAAPKGGFPATPPLEAGVIATGLSDKIITPSAHMFDLAVSRDLGRGFSFEAAYVGRLGRDVPVRYDLFMPLNLVDKKSGMDYFTAAQQLIRATQAAGVGSNAAAAAYSAIAPIAYWENLWPAAAAGGLTATQAMARAFNRNAPDYITALYDADESCDPACSIFGPFAYFDREFDSLGALATIGHSRYNALQMSVRKRFSEGYQFDVNYTLAKSMDSASSVERGSFFGNFGSGGSSGFLINSWDTESTYSYSDFDIRHQMNANWITDLPFGRGKKFGRDMNPVVNQFVGDWSIAGLVRWTSGFPFNVANCRSCWATNWNLQGNAMLVDPSKLPETETTRNVVNGYPSPFPKPADALKFFRYQLPGESGFRNLLRGDGYFTVDLSISKAWSLPFANNKIRFRWDTFNLTNTPRFDTAGVTMTPDRSATFGRYNGTLATCDAQAGRCMQFGLRYEF